MNTKLAPADVCPVNPPLSEIAQLISEAMQITDFDMVKFEKLLALKREDEDRERQRVMEEGFLAAKAQFLVDCPDIPHDKKAPWGKYASLGQITRIVSPILGQHGLSIQWERTDDAVACVLTHVGGFSQRSYFPLSIDGQQGGMSKMTMQQRMGSADTYAERRALKAVCGLGSVDEDSDGADPEPKNEKQSHNERANQIKIDWLAPRHELDGRTTQDKAREFAAWFLTHTNATTFTPHVTRWTDEQLDACRAQLDKEATARSKHTDGQSGTDAHLTTDTEDTDASFRAEEIREDHDRD